MYYKQNNLFCIQFFRLRSFLPSCDSFTVCISIIVNVVSAQRKTFKLLRFVPIKILIDFINDNILLIQNTRINRFATPLEITKES
jgi:hypothetical protein